MKWLKNLEQIATDNTTGVCPYCESSDTEYSAKEISNGVGFAVIWCNNCKHAFNISRIKINNNTITKKEIPNGLIY